MSSVVLLDRDDVEQPRGTSLVHPDALYPRKAGTLNLVPDHAGLDDAPAKMNVGRWPHRSCHGQYRIVAVVNSLHPNHRLLRLGACIIAGELAKRALRL